MKKIFIDVGIDSSGSPIEVERFLDTRGVVGTRLGGGDGRENRGYVEDGTRLLERQREL